MVDIEYLAGSTRDAARMLFLAGTLDRLIFKFKKRPEDLIAAGFRLYDLIPSFDIIDFRTERLNHVFRDSLPLVQLQDWLPAWDALTQRSGFRIRIDASRDRTKLLPAEYLAGLFSYEVPELASIEVAAPVSWARTGEHWAGRIALIDAGSVSVPDDYEQLPATRRSRFVTPDDIVRVRMTKQEGDTGGQAFLDPLDYEVGLAIVTSGGRGQDSLNAFLSQADPVRAPAAIFVQHEPQRLAVTARLLDAVMERSRLIVAGIVPSTGSRDGDASLVQTLTDGYQDISRLAELMFKAGRFSANQRRDPDEVNLGPSDWLWGPLIRSRPLWFHGDGLIDPRKYLDSLIGDLYDTYEHVFAQRAAADSVAQRGITQIDELRRLQQEPDQRYVQLQVLDGADFDATGGKDNKTSVLRASTDYTAKIFLDSIWDATGGADRPLPAYEAYDDGQDKSELEVIFTPLFFSADSNSSEGQIGQITVPKIGRSSSVRFAFSTPEDLRKFRVRIVIRHRTAILQTLIFALEPLAGDPAIGIPYRLVVESDVVRSSSPARPESMRFDLSLILNDSLTGESGVLSIQDQRAVFFEPTDWQKFVSNIQDTLQVLTCPTNNVFPNLFDDVVVDRLRELALLGKVALDTFKTQAPAINVSGAKSVQVIEAVSGAFFPVEFFYDGEAPKKDALLCEHAVEALSVGTCNASSTNCGTNDVICPIAFWGLNRRIERGSNRDQQNNAAVVIPRDFEVVPRSLRTALVGASVRVRARDLNDLEAILSTNMPSVFSAAQWSEWRAKLAERRPDLLVLLPHSAHDQDHLWMSTLEIGRDHLGYANMSDKYVVSEGGQPPLVLLLGCETALPSSMRFMNFATRFWHHGASTVLATLSGVSGHHVAAFAGDLSNAMAATVGATGETDFGTVLLSLKREMLARGNVLALTLICYGDTSWRMEKGV